MVLKSNDDLDKYEVNHKAGDMELRELFNQFHHDL